MDKRDLLKELRYLVSRPEMDDVPMENLEKIRDTIRGAMAIEVDPTFQIDGFICRLRGFATKDCFVADIDILDPNHPYLSKAALEKIMSHYGVHGKFRYVFKYTSGGYPSQLETPVSIVLSVFMDDMMSVLPSPDTLSLREARFLELRVKGLTQKEIAKEEGLSLSTVGKVLRRIPYKTSRYGFRQIWPDTMDMPYSEEECDRALKGKAMPWQEQVKQKEMELGL